MDWRWNFYNSGTDGYATPQSYCFVWCTFSFVCYDCKCLDYSHCFFFYPNPVSHVSYEVKVWSFCWNSIERPVYKAGVRQEKDASYLWAQSGGLYLLFLLFERALSFDKISIFCCCCRSFLIGTRSSSLLAMALGWRIFFGELQNF